MKNYGLTVGALVVALIVLAIVIIVNAGKSREAEKIQNETYIPPTNNVTINSDYLDLSDAEAKGTVVIPNSSKYYEDGKPDITVERNEDGNISGAVYYEYLEDGSPIAEKRYSGRGSLISKTVFAAEEKGCVKSVYTMKTDKNGVYDGHILEELNEDGVVVKLKEFTVTGVVDHYSYFEYNENGQAIKETEYSPYDVVLAYYEYHYDGFGRKVEAFQYDANHNPFARTAFDYDEEDRITRESYYLNDVCRSYNEYEYREDGAYRMTAYTLVDEKTMTYDKKIMIDY